jgi:hypothetical protein
VAQNACTALGGADPARPHAGRHGRGWPRPTRGRSASLPLRPFRHESLQRAKTAAPLKRPARRNGILQFRRANAAAPLKMQHMKAQVRNGRLLVDEPTDLPEGKVIELVRLDEVFLNGGDDLDAEERAALHREIEASMAEAEAGELVDFDVVLAELRSPS